jgi:thiol-disulfide isomerase/thioredoxin
VTTGIWVLLAALALATAVGLGKRWYDGRFRAPHGTAGAQGSDAGQGSGAGQGSDAGEASGSTPRLAAADLDGADLGERATLVQFSTAFCQPCRATRRVLSDIADVVPGVTHVEIDAESHLDLVRRLDVLRTPTTLVLDATGRVTTRASGQPRKEQVLAALPL